MVEKFLKNFLSVHAQICKIADSALGFSVLRGNFSGDAQSKFLCYLNPMSNMV